jgi:thymidylate kinase
MEKPKIISLGFEGSHRSGKGTQIELLSSEFERNGIPFLVVRGDGSRPNEGKHSGDPVSEWWSNMLPELRKENADLEDWNQSSYRLARELVVFRDRVLPGLCELSESNLAFLLVDRSILSRTMIPRELESAPTENSLYPPYPGARGPVITPEKVCPDLLFNFIAEAETLLCRLDPSDPKYIIRKRNIENKASWYMNAVEFIPESLRSRVINIDAEASPEHIQQEIREILMNKIPELNQFIIKRKAKVLTAG